MITLYVSFETIFYSEGSATCGCDFLRCCFLGQHTLAKFVATGKCRQAANRGRGSGGGLKCQTTAHQWKVVFIMNIFPSNEQIISNLTVFGIFPAFKVTSSTHILMKVPDAGHHSCQMAIASYLDRMCLALRAWRTMAPLRCAHALHPGAIQGKEGIKFCHLVTLFLSASRRNMP